MSYLDLSRFKRLCRGGREGEGGEAPTKRVAPTCIQKNKQNFLLSLTRPYACPGGLNTKHENRREAQACGAFDLRMVRPGRSVLFTTMHIRAKVLTPRPRSVP